MRKIYSAICVICIALLIPAIIQARGMLPMDRQPMIEEKYGGWAGVLRIWVCEAWPVGAGSCGGWLNRCISAYEKRHKGVYIQPEYVSAEVIAQLGEGGIVPPDMVLFPPSALEDGRMLIPIEAPDCLREGLADCGRGIAVPVCMGGYMWAYNASLLPEIPPSWSGQEVEIAVPTDDRRLWSAALLALCSSRYTEGQADEAQPPIAPELDLGLVSASAAMERGCILPEGFAQSGSAWRDFINGEAGALIVSQREVRRLQTLSEQGKGPDWRLTYTGEGAFTDQVMFAGIVNRGSSKDGSERLSLCRQFIEHLLSDACQSELYRVGAFSVTEAMSGYSAGDPLSAMEAALRRSAPVVPPCFGNGWQREVQSIVRIFIEGEREASGQWRELSQSLQKIYEH